LQKAHLLALTERGGMTRGIKKFEGRVVVENFIDSLVRMPGDPVG
jgi:hypothetical protein